MSGTLLPSLLQTSPFDPVEADVCAGPDASMRADAHGAAAPEAAQLREASPTKEPLQGGHLGPQAGEVDVMLMGGSCIRLPVHYGQRPESLKEEFVKFRAVPRGMILQLLQPTGIVQAHEDMSNYAGASLTALFTVQPLDAQSRKMLLRCTLRQPEEGHIGLLEVPFKLEAHEADTFAKLLRQIQPSRLIFSNTKFNQDALTPLVRSMEGELSELHTLQIDGLNVDSLVDLATFMSKCPNLRRCDIQKSALTKNDVAKLRAGTTALVVI